jgi:uncharacterized protein YjbJ (UPF0337 family)
VETDTEPRLFRASSGHTNRAGIPDREEATMGLLDKLRNKGESAKGAAKQKTGEAIGNEQMQAEGKAGSAKGNLKQAGENVKDAL